MIDDFPLCMDSGNPGSICPFVNASADVWSANGSCPFVTCAYWDGSAWQTTDDECVENDITCFYNPT
jgi:hypothetical protein